MDVEIAGLLLLCRWFSNFVQMDMMLDCFFLLDLSSSSLVGALIASNCDSISVCSWSSVVNEMKLDEILQTNIFPKIKQEASFNITCIECPGTQTVFLLNAVADEQYALMLDILIP